jgi:hypothetical protein
VDPRRQRPDDAELVEQARAYREERGGRLARNRETFSRRPLAPSGDEQASPEGTRAQAWDQRCQQERGRDPAAGNRLRARQIRLALEPQKKALPLRSDPKRERRGKTGSGERHPSGTQARLDDRPLGGRGGLGHRSRRRDRGRRPRQDQGIDRDSNGKLRRRGELGAVIVERHELSGPVGAAIQSLDHEVSLEGRALARHRGLDCESRRLDKGVHSEPRRDSAAEVGFLGTVLGAWTALVHEPDRRWLAMSRDGPECGRECGEEPSRHRKVEPPCLLAAR